MRRRSNLGFPGEVPSAGVFSPGSSTNGAATAEEIVAVAAEPPELLRRAGMRRWGI